MSEIGDMSDGARIAPMINSVRQGFLTTRGNMLIRIFRTTIIILSLIMLSCTTQKHNEVAYLDICYLNKTIHSNIVQNCELLKMFPYNKSRRISDRRSIDGLLNILDRLDIINDRSKVDFISHRICVNACDSSGNILKDIIIDYAGVIINDSLYKSNDDIMEYMDNLLGPTYTNYLDSM